MAYETKPGQGSIFKNEKKTENTHPDYTGSCVTPDGTECWISLFVKKPDGKKPFFSVSIRPKQEQQQSKKQELLPMDDDDLPF